METEKKDINGKRLYVRHPSFLGTEPTKLDEACDFLASLLGIGLCILFLLCIGLLIFGICGGMFFMLFW